MDEPGFDIEACLEGLRRRDERAASDFVREHYPLVLKIVRSHLPRRTAEEDLCQVVFIKILSNIGQYSGKVPIAHWVSRIAINTCLNALKAESIRPEIRWADLTPEESDIFDATRLEGSTRDATDAIHARDLVDKLLSTLEAEDRSLILMVDLEGRSLEEISETTGWGISKIKMRLFRIRNQLRKTIQTLEQRS